MTDVTTGAVSLSGLDEQQTALLAEAVGLACRLVRRGLPLVEVLARARQLVERGGVPEGDARRLILACVTEMALAEAVTAARPDAA